MVAPNPGAKRRAGRKVALARLAVRPQPGQRGVMQTLPDLAAARDAGFSDGEIAEILAHVALNVFTNYFNVATDVDIDFPKVSYSEVA